MGSVSLSLDANLKTLRVENREVFDVLFPEEDAVTLAIILQQNIHSDINQVRKKSSAQ